MTAREDYVAGINRKAEESGIEKAKKTTLDYYYEKKINDNYVLLLGLGKGARGNVQYILDVLNHDPQYAHLKMFIRTSKESDEVVQNFIKKNHWDRTTTVYKASKYYELLETCKYLITEVYFSEFWIKREGQIVINIWHGTPLKRLGLEKKGLNKYADGLTQKNFIAADYLLYPNTYTKDNMMMSYRVADLYQGKILLNGYPRTGAIMDQSHNEETLSVIAPKGEKVYVYMPTWKDYLSLEQVLAESKALLEYLDENLKPDQRLYVNLHHKVSDQLDYSRFTHIFQFPSDIDSYRIQAAADALITDYSSVFYDYSACGKNIILYCNDLELYEKKRGTYMDLRTLPFHKARTPKEVLDAINTGKNYDDTEFVKEFCSRDTTKNAERLCKLFVGEEEGLEILPVEKKFHEKVLLYCDDLRPSLRTGKFLRHIKRLEQSGWGVYLSGDGHLVRENAVSYAPTLQKLQQKSMIGVKTTPRYSQSGNYAKQLYEKKVIDFSEAMKLLAYDYELEFLRYYGTKQFDKVIVYDTASVERLLALSCSGIPTEIIVNKTMLKEIKKGNDLWKDALVYFLQSSTVEVKIPLILRGRAQRVLETKIQK